MSINSAAFVACRVPRDRTRGDRHVAAGINPAAVDQSCRVSRDRAGGDGHGAGAGNAAGGELVPQDPNDESTSVLLERIKAEREAQAPARKKTKTRTRSTEVKEESSRASTKSEAPEEVPSNNESKRDADEHTVVPIDETDRDDVMAIVRDVFEEYEELDRDDAIHEVSHKLGYKRTGSQIRDILSDDIRTAMRRDILYSDNGMYRLGCQSIDDYKRDELIKYLLSAMGRTWWEQQDAIREATRHLGFRRTGKKIQQAFESAINSAIRRDLLERDEQSLRRL